MSRILRALVSAVAVLSCTARGAAGQSVLERSPNLSAGWVGPSGTLHFNFLHRFDVSGAPLRKVSNIPTFLLAYGLPVPALVGAHYSTSSDVAAGLPNEWEFFARYAPVGQARGWPLDLSLQVGYNEAAGSVDGEVSVGRTIGPVRLFAAGRGFSDGYASGDERWAVAGGASVRLFRRLAVAGDVGSLVDRGAAEELAWGAALQVAIPYTPHTLSLQVSNTSTGTLQGASRGIENVRFGFEFTIPLTLSRYFGGGPPAEGRAAAAAGVVAAGIENFAHAPARIEVAAGTTIEWTNRDPVDHTVTADDGAWDSGLIEPGGTWRRTFDRPGTYPFHCTPHPFMRGVVVVREAAP